MLRILLCSLFCFLLIASPVLAEDQTPSPQPVASQGQVLGIFDNLFNFLNNLLGEKQVPEKITAVYQRSNPILSADSTASSTGTNVEKATIGYAFAKAGLTPNETPTNRQTFFDKIMSFFNLGLTDSLVVKGNEDAEDFASARLPNNVSRQVIAGSQVNSFLAQGDTNVLGASASGQAAAEGLDVALCSALPPALCPLGDYGGTNPDIPPPPPGDLPAECQGGYGPNDHYYDYTTGTCPIMTAGYCSEACQKNFWKDPVLSKKASQICQAESTGEPFVISRRRCDLDNPADRTKEYSIGLFQINLWWDDRCPGAITILDPNPPYFCQKGPNYQQCETTFSEVAYNSNFGVKLYNGRGGNFKDWSTAVTCNIK